MFTCNISHGKESKDEKKNNNNNNNKKEEEDRDSIHVTQATTTYRTKFIIKSMI